MNDQIATSLYSALAKNRRKMLGEEDENQLSLAGDDPLFRLQIHDPSYAAKTRKAAALGFAVPELNKRPRLSRSSSVSSTVSSSTASSASSRKRKPVVLKSPLLHQSCRLFSKCAPVIESSLEMEPEAACKRAESARKGSNSSYLVGDGKVPYSLPINILLHQEASLEVVKLMAQAAPEALLMNDGRDECCALIIALRLFGHCTLPAQEEEEDRVPGTGPPTVPEEVLTANPAAAQLHDRRRNFPLHVAAYVGCSFSVINKLYYAYPEALLETNFHGETPMDICIRNGKCSERSSNFLQEKMGHLKTARLRSMAK